MTWRWDDTHNNRFLEYLISMYLRGRVTSTKLLSYRPELSKFYRTKFAALLQRIDLALRRRMHSNLSHMGVTAILMVADHRYLDHKRSDRLFTYVVDGDDHPACAGKERQS